MRYFIDCEFDGFRGPLISMALIREDGRSLYFVMFDAEEAADEWVRDNVVPILMDAPEAPYRLDRAGAASAIAGFVGGDEGPHFVADWPDDLRHLCDLIVFEGGEMAPLPSFTMEVKRIDAYPTSLENAVRHNAWWDALALRQKVLEMEAVAGRPEPGLASADGPRVGDVVALMSGGVAMTVTLAPEFSEVGGDMVRVAWMTDAGDMNETELPVDALRLRRQA